MEINAKKLSINVPAGILDVLDRHDYKIYVHDGEDEHDAYQHAVRGRCMTCGNELEEETLLMVSGDGILGLWCSGRCISDMHAITFLTVTMDNIIEAVNERSEQ